MIKDISEYEEGLREEFRGMVNDLANVEAIVKDIKKLIKKHQTEHKG